MRRTTPDPYSGCFGEAQDECVPGCSVTTFGVELLMEVEKEETNTQSACRATVSL